MQFDIFKKNWVSTSQWMCGQGVGVIVDYTQTSDFRILQSKIFAKMKNYGAQMESFQQKNCRKSRDTVPLRRITYTLKIVIFVLCFSAVLFCRPICEVRMLDWKICRERVFFRTSAALLEKDSSTLNMGLEL